MLLDTLEFFRESSSSEIPDQVWENVENVILKTFVPQMKVGSERPCEESDYKEYVLEIGSKFKILTFIFHQIANNVGCEKFDANKRVSKNLAVYLLLLCGEHSDDDKWTTEETIKYSGELISHLCKLCQCKSISELLTGVESRHEFVGLFSTALLFLRPKLLKDTWKSFPAAVSCYQWLMFHVKVTIKDLCSYLQFACFVHSDLRCERVDSNK